MSKKRSLFIILLCFFFAYLLAGFPFRSMYSSEYLLGDGGDSLQFLYLMHGTHQNIVTGKPPFAWRNDLRYPDGFSLYRACDGVFALLSGAFFLFVLPPVLSYHSTVVLILFLNLVVSFFAFSFLQKLFVQKSDMSVSFLASLVFGASPFVLARINGHLNLAFVAGFPILLSGILSVINKLKKSQPLKTWDFAFIALGVYVVSLGSLQYLIALVWTVFIVSACVFFWLGPKRFFDRVTLFLLAHLPLICLPLLACTLSLVLTFYGYIGAVLFTNYLPNSPVIHGTLLDFIVPNSYLDPIWSGLNPSAKGIERVWTIGAVELLLVFFILSKSTNTRLRKIYICIFIATFVYGLGYINLPFYNEEPRYIVFLALATALLVLLEGVHLSGGLKMLFIVAFFIERIFMTPFFTKLPLSQNAYATLGQGSGAAVLTVPLLTSASVSDTIPVFSGKKVFDGYFSMMAEQHVSRKTLALRLSAFNCQDTTAAFNKLFFQSDSMDKQDFTSIKQLLYTENVRQVLVYKRLSQFGLLKPRCASAYAYLDGFLSYLQNENTVNVKVSYEDDVVKIFSLTYLVE